MILTGEEIITQRNLKRIVIDPFNEDNVGPNSVDLTLARRILVYKGLRLDPKKENETEEIVIPEDGMWLYPGTGYLGGTIERCGSDEFVCDLDGRSSIGRLFLAVHCTAGNGDLGFDSRWCLEMYCTTQLPVKVYPEMKIVQARFHSTIGTKGILYKNRKYSDQEGATASRIHKDFI